MNGKHQKNLAQLVLAGVGVLLLLFVWAEPALASGGGAVDGSPSRVPWNDTIEAIINFSLFIFLLYYFAKKPVSAFLVNRTKEISSQLEEAKRLREEAEAKLEEYGSKLEGFEEQRKKILEGYRREAERESNAILDDAKRHAERARADSKLVIEFELKRARRELRERVIDEAVDVARSTIKAKLDENGKRKLVDQFTDSLTGLAEGR